MYYVMVHLAGGILLLLAFEYTGRMLARILGLPTRQTDLPITLHFALGCAVWVVALIALGLVGALHPGLIRALVGSVILLAGFDWVRRVRADGLPRPGLFDPARWSGFGWLDFAALAAITSPLLIYYLQALSPALSWDADNYHLVLPRLFLEHGGFRSVPFSLYATWPLNTEMLFTLAMSFQDFLLAKTLHFAFGLFLAVAVFETARRGSLPIAGLIAVFLLLNERLVAFEISIAYVDLTISLYYFLGFLVWQQANFRGPLARPLELRLLFMVGICAAFFAGSKLTGAIVIVIFIGMQLAIDLARRRDLRTLMTNGLVIGLPALALVLPWFIKAWVMVGDPLHPGLYPIFQGGGEEWSAELARGAFEYHSSRGMGREPLDYLLLPARLIGMLDLDATGGFAADDLRGGGYRGWWAGILPFLIWGAFRLRNVRLLLVPAGIYFVYWSQSSQIARLLMPVLPFLCCAAGISIAEAVERVATRVGSSRGAGLPARLLRAGPGVLMLFFALTVWWNHPILTVKHLSQTMTYYSLPQSKIVDWAILGHFKFINEELPEDARVMMINYSRGFYCERDYIADSLFASSQMSWIMRDVRSPQDLQRVFKHHGITHVLYTARADPPKYPAAFYRAMKHGEGLKLVRRAGKIRVYEVVP